MLKKPFELPTGTLDVFNPQTKTQYQIDVGEPKSIVMWTPTGDTTLIFINYSKHKPMVQFQVLTKDVEEFNLWFKGVYGEE